MIVSGLLIRTGLFRYLNRIYAPVLGRLYRISDEGCYALFMGFLCGFPMGAKVTAELVVQGQITREEGDYLLGFCNNVSPAFFLNYVCLVSLHYPDVPWKLFGIFYGLPLLYGLVTRPFYHFRVRRTEVHTGKKIQAPLHRLDFPMLDTCIMDSFSTITRLGGYIILFTILIQMIGLLPLPAPALTFLSAVLEISCGVSAVSSVQGTAALLKTALVCTCAAFGGLCICAQTKSVISESPLHIGTWLRGRIIIAVSVFLLVLLPAAAPTLRGCW